VNGSAVGDPDLAMLVFDAIEDKADQLRPALAFVR
jgi:hypothetical protein